MSKKYKFKDNEKLYFVTFTVAPSGAECVTNSSVMDTKKIEVLNKLKGYSIIEGLTSNDKVIVGFIGNIKGMFVQYDLLYSLDKGKTWKIQKLKEKNYIKPSCLVGNILYIYAGIATMQKVVFE